MGNPRHQAGVHRQSVIEGRAESQAAQTQSRQFKKVAAGNVIAHRENYTRFM
jgi:hypothetical protein